MKRKEFEYMTRYKGSHEVTELNMAGFLNSQGKDGWELVHMISRPFIDKPWEIANYTFIFKRQKS
jgi:hypothetical protein